MFIFLLKIINKYKKKLVKFVTEQINNAYLNIKFLFSYGD